MFYLQIGSLEFKCQDYPTIRLICRGLFILVVMVPGRHFSGLWLVSQDLRVVWVRRVVRGYMRVGWRLCDAVFTHTNDSDSDIWTGEMFPGTGTGSDWGNHCSVCLPRVGSAGGRLLSGGHGYIVLVRSGLYDPPALGGGWWSGGWWGGGCWGGGHWHFVLVNSGFLVISVICSS